MPSSVEHPPLPAAPANKRPRLFSDGVFSRSLTPPEELTPSQWAERHVVIERSQSAFEGPLDHARAPYLAQMIDLVLAPGIAEINIQKASQVGVSAAMRWLIGYMAEREPDPCGITLPDREKGEQIIAERLIPFFEKTPPLRDLDTGNRHDKDKQQIKLANGFVLFLMWSGSPSSMASNPLRVVLNDEVDKFSSKAVDEADPIALTRRRTRTYGPRARLINISTPTTRSGRIAGLIDDSTVFLVFLVPCPACGVRQRLVWDRVSIAQTPEGMTSRKQRAAWVEANEAAHYECGSATCGAKWSERERTIAVRAGKWGTCGDDGLADGVIDDAMAIPGGRWPAGTKIGMHISALYAAFGETLPKIAARFIMAKGKYKEMMDFRQNDLGEPFEEQVDKSAVSSVAALHLDHAPEGVLPPWTARVLATIDTQKDHFWYTVRAWGPGMRSRRILHGRAESFDELDQIIYRTPFGFEGDLFPAMLIDGAGIDSGGTRKWERGATNHSDAPPGGASAVDGDPEATSRPSRVMEVYAWALQRQDRVRVFKGDSKPRPGESIRRGTGQYVAGGEAFKVAIWLLDVHRFQDELSTLMQQEVEEVNKETGEVTKSPIWALNARRDGEYERHMANLHKVTVREKGGKVAERWAPVSGGARVDYRACEGYMIALAELSGVRLLPELDQFMAMRAAAMAEEKRRAELRGPQSGLRTPDGRPFLASQR